MSETAPAIPMPRTRAWGILLLILGLATALRVWHIADASFWLDEFLTVELSSAHGLAHLDLKRGEITAPPPDYISLARAEPLHGIWTNSKRDVHPPLFYVLLRIWREVFGEGDGTVRMLSAVLSLTAIVAIFIAIDAQAGPTPALWASLLMAVSAAQIEFAQENRSYMLLEAALLGTCAALLCIEHRGVSWPRLIALGSFAFASIMSHYLALPLLGAIGIYSLLRLRGAVLRAVLLTFLISAVLFGIVWGPFAWAQTEGMLHRTSFVKATNWSIFNCFFNASSLPLRYFVSAPSRSRVIISMGAAIYFLPLLLIRERPSLLIWWLWLGIGVGSLTLSDLMRHGEMLAYLRYTVAVSPAAFALVSLMLSHLDGWFRHIVPMALSLGCMGAIEGAYIRYKPDWRGLAAAVEAKVQPQDVLIMFDDQPDPWEVRCDLVGIQYYNRPGPRTVIYLQGPPPPGVNEVIRNARAVWVFTPTLGIGAPAIFPHAEIAEGRFFEFIGSLVRVELPGSLSASSSAPAQPDRP